MWVYAASTCVPSNTHYIDWATLCLQLGHNTFHQYSTSTTHHMRHTSTRSAVCCQQKIKGKESGVNDIPQVCVNVMKSNTLTWREACRLLPRQDHDLKCALICTWRQSATALHRNHCWESVWIRVHLSMNNLSGNCFLKMWGTRYVQHQCQLVVVSDHWMCTQMLPSPPSFLSVVGSKPVAETRNFVCLGPNLQQSCMMSHIESWRFITRCASEYVGEGLHNLWCLERRSSTELKTCWRREMSLGLPLVLCGRGCMSCELQPDGM